MPGDAATPAGSLRIGELAGLAGTTTRAIRHYHARGLLQEPARDDSGYRRYGPDELVRLIQIRRLRALGMPLGTIATALDASGEPRPASEALHALAGEIAAEIDRLRALHARLLEVAAAGSARSAVEALLARHGGLRRGDALQADEGEAVDLLDALHPSGIAGVLSRVEPLVSDRRVAARLDELLQRFRQLPDDADAAHIDELASGYLAALPGSLPAPLVDLDAMERLLGRRFSPAQLAVLRRLRELSGAAERP